MHDAPNAPPRAAADGELSRLPLAPGPRDHALRIVRRFRRDNIAVYQQIVRDYGNIASFQLGRRWVYIINEPEVIHDILVTSQDKFVKSRGLQFARELLGDGLLTSERPLHLRQRRMLQPHFHADAVAGYAGIVSDLTARMAADWQAGATIDVHAQMMAITLGIVGRALFAAEVESETRQIADSLAVLMQDVMRAVSSPLFALTRHLPGPRRWRARRGAALLDRTIYRIIDNAQHQPPTGGTPTLLQMLLAAEDDVEGGGMSRKQVRDEALTLLLAGHETTANALAWAWYLLSRHDQVAARLHREVDALLSPRGARDRPIELTAGDVDALPYTRMVITETMRLYPPAYVVGRQAVADHQAGGFLIPAGSTVLISQYVMHRDQRFYPDPESFRPERWQDQAARPPRFTYFPFGGGPRVCIGEPLAWLEAILILAGLSYRWQLRRPEGLGHPQLQPLFTLRPRDGLDMLVAAR